MVNTVVLFRVFHDKRLQNTFDVALVILLIQTEVDINLLIFNGINPVFEILMFIIFCSGTKQIAIGQQ